MKTQRVTLLVSKEDKRRFKEMAEDRGVSVSELVRQAVDAYNVSSIHETGDPHVVVSGPAALLLGVADILEEHDAS